MDPESSLPLAALRGLTDASLLSLFGALAFRTAIAPAGLRIARWSGGAALLALPAWLAAEALDLGGTLSAVLQTAFAHQVAATAACVLLALLTAAPGWRLAVALPAAAAAIVVHAGHSHAWAMQPGLNLLTIASALHLLAAAAWLGGLLPLRAALRGPDPLHAARRFSTLGIACVATLAVTAASQSATLVGGLPGWVGTGYGRVALVKLALFATLVAIAAYNRQRLTPAGRTRALVRSIAVETALGLATIAAAGLLTSLEPAMHLQPTWPFPLQPSLATLTEAPELWQEVAPALAALAAATTLLAAALATRRRRIPAAILAIAATLYAVPHLDLFFIPAYPTSFYRSPTGFTAAAITTGAARYAQHCTACHGLTGTGNGPLATALAVPPADLTAEHLWMHPDGELFWWLTHGIDGPDSRLAMPGFATLPPDDRWALIDYIRANNAGLHHAATGSWSPPLQAPALATNCQAAPARLTFTAAVTLTAGQGPPCTVEDPAARAAYAIALGAPPDGQTVLIDANGWLRSVQPSDLPPARLAGLLQTIDRTPLAATTEGHHHHAGN